MWNHWLVKVLTKVSGVVVVAFGGIAGLNWGCTRLFMWLCGPPRPSAQARLALVVEALEFNKTLLANKEQEFFTRINRIGLLANCIPKNGPLQKGMRSMLAETIKTHQSVIKSKEIPRLYFTISLLESAKGKLQDGSQNGFDL